MLCVTELSCSFLQHRSPCTGGGGPSGQTIFFSIRARASSAGDKWRIYPVWQETAMLLKKMMAEGSSSTLHGPVFTGATDVALTTFGIHKIVRRHNMLIVKRRADGRPSSISPHVCCHSTAVHLLE